MLHRYAGVTEDGKALLVQTHNKVRNKVLQSLFFGQDFKQVFPGCFSFLGKILKSSFSRLLQEGRRGSRQLEIWESWFHFFCRCEIVRKCQDKVFLSGVQVWDEELALTAQRWADQCHFGHDKWDSDMPNILVVKPTLTFDVVLKVERLVWWNLCWPECLHQLQVTWICLH